MIEVRFVQTWKGKTQVLSHCHFLVGFQLILFTIIINFLSETVDTGVCIYFGFKPHLIFLSVKRNVIKAVFPCFQRPL